MTDIVVVDGVTYVDFEVDALANFFPDTAHIVDAPSGGGSHLHLLLPDTAVARDSFLGGGTITLLDTAHLGDDLTLSRSLPLLDTVHLADSLIAGSIYAAGVIEIAVARDAAHALRAFATLADTAAVTDLLTAARALALRDTVHAADALTIHGTLKQVLADTAHVVDALVKPASTLALHDTAHLGDAVTLGVTSTGLLADIAHAVDALTLARSTQLALIDFVHAADAFAAKTTAQGVFEDTAEVDDEMRGVFASLPNLWLNTTTVAAALWDGVPFNSMVEKDGVLYGAGVEGLYAFTDRTGSWRGEVVWDLSDFDSAQRKRMLGVYVAGQANAAFTVRISNEQGSFDYDARYARGPGPMNHRAIPGRGLDSRYYRIAVVNTQDFGVNSVLVVHQETVRKI